jgi:hypothetical protein
MNRSQTVGSAIAAFAILSGAQASALTGDVVYREVFPFELSPPAYDETINATAGGTRDVRADRLIQQGWFGGNTGDNFETVGFNNTPDASTGLGEGVIDPGGPSSEQQAVNSLPTNLDTPTARGFQSQQQSNLFFYTNEFSLDSSLLTHVSWDSRNSRNQSEVDAGSLSFSTEALFEDKWGDQGTVEGTDTHVALRISGGGSSVWYVSQQGFLHQGDNLTWATNNALISDLEWVVFDNGPSDGSTLPGVGLNGSIFKTLVDLPTGTIDAFGLYTARNGGNIRIDNYALSAVPGPAALPLLLGALAGFGVMGWRKRRAA